MSLQETIKSLVKLDIPTVILDDPIRHVIQYMNEKDVSSVLVCTGEDVAGIISDTDLVDTIASGEDIDAVLVRDVMTACEIAAGDGTTNPCAQIDDDESVLNTLKVFNASGTHCLVVSTGDKSAPGLVVLRDVLVLAIS